MSAPGPAEPTLWIAIALALAAPPIAAQANSASSPLSAIVLTLRDTSSGPPHRRPFSVGVYNFRTAVGDHRFSGRGGRQIGRYRYRIDSVPVGRATLRLYCQTRTGRGYDAEHELTIAAGRPLDATITVHHAGCDTRPIRTVTGTFSGIYSGGFEVDGFVPCPRDSWVIPSDSVDDSPSASVVLTPRGARSGKRLPWPKGLEDSGGSIDHFVRWRGTVRGPGHYGRVKPFEITVDSVISHTAPTARSCGSAPSRPTKKRR
jgi:hypothetical protein